MKIIGIVGGIASGKTSAAQIFEQSGAVVLSADEIGHRVLQEAGIRQAAVERWGSEILDSSGKIDRKRLATIVFQDEEDLVFLEKLTHQRIRDQISIALKNLAQNHTAAVILDGSTDETFSWLHSNSNLFPHARFFKQLHGGPALGRNNGVENSKGDVIVFIESSLENREKRAADRGWTPEELARRESRQLSLQKKRASTSYTIHNDGSTDELEEEICRVWDSLQGKEMGN